MSEWTYEGWRCSIERDANEELQLRSEPEDGARARWRPAPAYPLIARVLQLEAEVERLKAELARTNESLGEEIKARDRLRGHLTAIADAAGVPVENEDEGEDSRWEEVVHTAEAIMTEADCTSSGMAELEAAKGGERERKIELLEEIASAADREHYIEEASLVARALLRKLAALRQEAKS